MLQREESGQLPGRAASRHRSVPVRAGEIVGRQPELGAVERFLDETARAPSGLLFDGEPGIGKTHVWAAGVRAAEERGYCVSVARPAGTETQLSFAALGDLLAPFLDEVLPRLPVPQRRALEVALLLSEPQGRPLEQRAVATGLLGALRVLTDASPVVVAIDDLQWLDAASARALEFASRRLELERLGILAAARVEGLDESASWLTSALGDDRLSRIHLAPLSRDALSRLLRSRLAVTFSPATLHRLYQVSGGNPFFALEVARALQSGTAELGPGGRLQTVGEIQHLIGDRLTMLPAETTQALAAAAALPRPTVKLVGSAIDSEVNLALRPAVEAGVIELCDGQIGFAHPLLASAAYGGLEATARRSMHRRLAAIVGEAEERARHLALAAEGPDESVAAALDEAARGARARGAPEAAADLGEQALRLTPPIGQRTPTVA
jgi:AAA ATPase-like protein